MSQFSNSELTFASLAKKNASKLSFHNLIRDRLSDGLPDQTKLDIHHRIEASIKKHIEMYNSKMNEIIETLNHIHIKEIMFFNELLETNDSVLQEGSVEEFLEVPKEKTIQIFQLEKAIHQVISSPLKSFEARTTFDSKNKVIFSQNSSVPNASSLRMDEGSLRSSFSGRGRPQQSRLLECIDMCESIVDEEWTEKARKKNRYADD